MTHINWPHIRARLREAILVLPHFFRNPVNGMRMLPEWDWPTMLILQGIFAAACAILGNILERNYLGVITGLVIAPLMVYVVTGIFSGLFFYTFMFFFQREVPFRQIYLHLIFAMIPVQVVGIVSGLIPPLILLGGVATAMLLYVGFASNFHLERPKLKKLLAGLMAIYVAFWAVQLVRTSSRHEQLRLKATPESLDILEKELSDD